LQCRSARFFRASTTDVLFRPKLACSHLFGMENISPPWQKTHYSPILVRKNDSRRRPGKTRDRGLKMKFHRMMPIEHFLIAIMQISFSNWIEKITVDIGREIVPTDIFQPTLRNFFLKRSLADNVFFFAAEEVFLFLCCIKNLQCRLARFFRASTTEFLFRPKLACSHLFGHENISPPRQKNIIHRYWSEKMTVDFGQERWSVEV